MTCGLSPADKKTPQDTPITTGPQLREITERTSHFYFRRLREEISPDELPSLEPHFQQLMNWVNHHLLPEIDRGQHPHIKPEHANDTLETIQVWEATHRHSQIATVLSVFLVKEYTVADSRFSVRVRDCCFARKSPVRRGSGRS